MNPSRQYDRVDRNGHPEMRHQLDILTEKPTCGNKEISWV